MNEARRHAVTASELLGNTERFSERLAAMTPDEHMQMIATGGFARANADLHWTAELAIAHALTALALIQTEDLGDVVAGQA
jgi:hypothetical protein